MLAYQGCPEKRPLLELTYYMGSQCHRAGRWPSAHPAEVIFILAFTSPLQPINAGSMSFSAVFDSQCILQHTTKKGKLYFERDIPETLNQQNNANVIQYVLNGSSFLVIINLKF